LEPENWAAAEAQVAALSDDIAYLTHDVDDGLRAGLLTLAELTDVPFVGPFAAAVLAEGEGTDKGRAVFEVTRRMITALIRDVVLESRNQLASLAPQSPDEIRAAGRPVIRFSAPLWAELTELRAVLFDRVYRHPRVLRVMTAAEGIVRDLFGCYADPNHRTALPDAWQVISESLDPRRRARLAADYLAGQTDRYAIAEHRRLFAETPELR
jgi:dGTPase